MSECYYCDRLKGDSPDPVVYEDDLLHLSHAVNEEGPLSHLGYLVLETKRHTDHGLASLTDEESQRAGLLIARLSRALREVQGAGWTYTYLWTEAWKHYHQFVVARYPKMPEKYSRLAFFDWKGFPRGTRQEVKTLADRLSRFLEGGSAAVVPRAK